jgi:hypothetical protein
MEVDSSEVASSVAKPAVATGSKTGAEPAKGSEGHHYKEETRVPLIKFLGKRDKTKHDVLKHSAPSTPSTPTPIQPTVPVKKSTGLAVEFTSLKNTAFYGRPLISSVEIEAVESGGASIC